MATRSKLAVSRSISNGWKSGRVESISSSDCMLNGLEHISPGDEVGDAVAIAWAAMSTGSRQSGRISPNVR